MNAVSTAFLIMATLAGCAGGSSSDVELEAEQLEGLEYAIPAGWTSTDQSEHQTKIIVWTPPNNSRKESIALIRTKESPALLKSDAERLQLLLSEAQRNLPDGKFGTAVRFTTKHGLIGARVDGQLVREQVVYRRMHALVVDGSSLVHVLYTARAARPDTFNLVLDSLIRKAG